MNHNSKYQTHPKNSPRFLCFTADFRDMIESRNNPFDLEKEKFFINDVVHKAIIEVDEKGSKAAAVSSSIFGNKNGVTVKNKWIFDRPFLYAIMDKKHMIPLFIGRVVDPSEVNQLPPRPQSSTTTLHQQNNQQQPHQQQQQRDLQQQQMILKSLNSKIMEVLRKLNTESTNDTLIRKLKEVHNEITNLDSKLGKILM